jgi:hypothetical protein
MALWSRYPTLYEINTWVWLNELARGSGKKVDLSTVPPTEWDSIASYGFDAVWLMGVWERSPAGIAIANRNPGLLQDFQGALPDFQSADNVGSPYCIRRYVVDDRLGGTEGLAIAREQLANRGMKLLLDFVPNHVAPDHPWVAEHPEYFLHGSSQDAKNSPGSYIEVHNQYLACGKDPYFPAWPDVLQLNAFQPGLRQSVVETLANIAAQCDGVRCDMAMLLLNDVFKRTWGARAGQTPSTEYWDDVVPAVKRAHPGFLFIAEAYWDLEWELQQHGFDFCYDKRLYDRLEQEDGDCIYAPTWSIRTSCCAFSKTTMNRARLRHSRERKKRLRPSPSRPCPEPGCFTKDSSKGAGCGCRYFWRAGRTKRWTRIFKPSTANYLRQLIGRYSAAVSGRCASVAAGPTTQAL